MSNRMPTTLEKILQHKTQEVFLKKQKISYEKIEKLALSKGDNLRDFTETLKAQARIGKAGIIAEIKKASPSKGVIREDFNPEEIAVDYAKAGASCLSVLTDQKFFQGSSNYLGMVRQACQLPVLRKDFIIDPYQIFESRILGADCILLIVGAFVEQPLYPLHDLAQQLGMDVLLEVHNRKELEQALSLDNTLIGINNRNLHDFSVNINTTLELLEQIPKDRLVVTESGIHTSEDIDKLFAHQVTTFLIGEAFMRAKKPGRKLKELFADRL